MDSNENEPPQASKKRKAERSPEPKERVSSAIYVTSLPKDVTEDELYDVFSKYGMIAESIDNNQPRIKLYKEENGELKGDALIVYFRPESVNLAITMLDDTDFRYYQKVPTGPMRIRVADTSFKAQKEKPAQSKEAKEKGTSAYKDRQKIIKKTQEMNQRLMDWDDDDPQALPEVSSRWDKVVILKHMFRLQELKDDPAAMLDIKDDVRDEAEKLGQVTNVVLYDKEPEGIMTIRFTDPQAAQACVRLFDGRWYDEQRIEASIAQGKEHFMKSRNDDVDAEKEEKRRLQNLANDDDEEKKHSQKVANDSVEDKQRAQKVANDIDEDKQQPQQPANNGQNEV